MITLLISGGFENDAERLILEYVSKLGLPVGAAELDAPHEATSHDESQ